jgi:hypothetical protein
MLVLAILGVTVVAGVAYLWDSPQQATAGESAATETPSAEEVSFDPEESYVDYGAYDED